MPGRNRLIKISTREQGVSQDVEKAQRLASKADQDHLFNAGRIDDRQATPLTFSNFNDIENPVFVHPIVTHPPSLIPNPGGATAWEITVGDGEAMFLANPDSNQYDSQYQLARWVTTPLQFTPTVGFDRVDLIIATPADFVFHTENRNILTDPVNRVIESQLVDKIIEPRAVLSVIPGPTGVTVPPKPDDAAVPVGSVILFEVYVPSVANDATELQPISRARRQVSFPLSSYHGIISGMQLEWEALGTEVQSAKLKLGSTQDNQLLINGEMIRFTDVDLDSSFTNEFQNVYQDAGAANPFASAAPTHSDKPYYIYAVGGRFQPQGGRANSLAHRCPIILVESLTPPTRFGHPQNTIFDPRQGVGTYNGVFIACGWVIKNTTLRKGCWMSDDWVYPLTGQNIGPANASENHVGFNDTATRTLDNVIATQQSIGTMPATGVAKAMRLTATLRKFGGTTGPFGISIGRYLQNTSSPGAVYGELSLCNQEVGTSQPHVVGHAIRPAVNDIGVTACPDSLNVFFQMWASGYQLAVRRLGG